MNALYAVQQFCRDKSELLKPSGDCAQATIEQMKEQLEDSRETTADVQRQLTKAVGETAALRQKAEVAEEGIRPEEVEDLKRKMGVRLQDSESQLEAALAKAVSLEKAKNRLQVELEAVAEDLEKVIY